MGRGKSDNRNLVGFGGFLQQRSGAAAVGTLQVLEDHDGDLSAFWRLEGGVDILGRHQGSKQQDNEGKYGPVFRHIRVRCGKLGSLPLSGYLW